MWTESLEKSNCEKDLKDQIEKSNCEKDLKDQIEKSNCEKGEMLCRRAKLLQGAIASLHGALAALVDERRQSRLTALYGWFLRPRAFLGAIVMCSLFAGLFYAMGCRGRLCFSLGVLCYMVPLLVHIWRTSDIRQLDSFWSEIRRSDEAMAELADRELLLWAEQPEVEWELGATIPKLEELVDARLDLLQHHLDAIPESERTSVEEVPYEEPKPVECDEFIVD